MNLSLFPNSVTQKEESHNCSSNMAPTATNTQETDTVLPSLGLQLPLNAAKRLSKSGIDLTAYPTRPEKPKFLDQVYSIRSEFRYSGPTAVIYQAQISIQKQELRSKGAYRSRQSSRPREKGSSKRSDESGTSNTTYRNRTTWASAHATD